MAILRRTSVIDGKLVIEEIDDPNFITVPKKEKLKTGEFIFVFQKAIEKLVKEADLQKNSLRILLYLMAKTEFEKEINGTLYAMAKELNIKQSNATLAMKELEAIGIVVRNKELRTFRLNYEIAFKGSPKNYSKLKFSDPILLEPIKSKQTTILDAIADAEAGVY